MIVKHFRILLSAQSIGTPLRALAFTGSKMSWKTPCSVSALIGLWSLLVDEVLASFGGTGRSATGRNGGDPGLLHLVDGTFPIEI